MLAGVTIAVALGANQAAGEQAKASTYANSKFGVSFQYPVAYQLFTGEDANLSWGYLGQVDMNFFRPGGVTLAAVELPTDSYPGTDFNLGFFAVRINSALDASECGQFSHPNPDQPEFPPPLPTKAKVGANEFAKTEDGEAAMMKQAASEYYHIFRNDICYEFELGLGTAGFGAVDGMKQVDGDDVFRKLKAILATAKISPVAVAKPAIRIHSFDATLVTSAKPTTYRISWDVPSVPLWSMWIKTDCGDHGLGLWQTAEGEEKESPRKCADAIPLPSNKGSFLLRFKSNDWVHPELTLVVEGKSAVSKTRVLVVSPSPAIKNISGGECEEDFDNQSLIPGYEFLMSGNGFSADDNIVRIGPIRLNLPSSDNGQFITVVLPKSFAPGHYEISVENALGKSDGYGVDVIPPPPPQNLTPGSPAAVHPTKELKPGGAPWPMLGRAANHAGFSSYAVTKNVALRWKLTAAAPLRSSPVIDAAEMTYVGSADRYLYAVNPNGTQKWRYKTCGEISSSPALSSDGTIYAISQDGELYAINSDDGTLKWKISVGQSSRSSPTVGADGTVYALCDSDLCAISPNGTRKWRFQTHLDSVGLTQASPAVGQTGTIYVAGGHCNEHSGVCSGELLSVNPDGTQKWRFATVGAIESSPVIGPDGSIYVVDSKRDETMAFLPSDLYAVSPEGALKWKFSGGKRSTFMPIPVVGPDGAIYAASGDCNLYALDPKGAQKWAFRMCTYGYSGGEQVPSPVLDAAGTIYIGSIDYGPKYTLLAIGRDGNLLWNYLIGESHESVPGLTSAAIGADGTIYLGSNNYSLYAIGTPLSAPVPTAAPVVGKIVISPDKIDFGMATTSAQHIGTVTVSASESNKLPVTLEKFSVSGPHYSLWKSDCAPGQPLDPGNSCRIDFFYSPALTTGETDFGEIVVTTNAEVVIPPGGRVPLTGGGKEWRPGP